jgi:AraC-like DNA-binding protein
MGQRLFGDRSIPIIRRANWEFFAVIRGRVSPFFHDDEKPVPVSSRLWAFPPGFAYGWTGEAGRACEVVVLHYDSAPRVLEQIVASRGPLSVSLNLARRNLLRDLAKKLKPHFLNPSRESEIHVQRALLDISLMALRETEERTHPIRTGDNFNKVVAAEKWLYDRLADNPSISDAASQIGLSTSQLNRLFHQVRKESPQQVLNRLKIDRAMKLLSSSNAKLHSVATECGFSSASNLCRAFKRQKGHSPTMWRQETGV